MDKNELKIQALREALRDKVSSITDEYENRIADLRVEITQLSERLRQYETPNATQPRVDERPVVSEPVQED